MGSTPSPRYEVAIGYWYTLSVFYEAEVETRRHYVLLDNGTPIRTPCGLTLDPSTWTRPLERDTEVTCLRCKITSYHRNRSQLRLM